MSALFVHRLRSINVSLVCPSQGMWNELEDGYFVESFSGRTLRLVSCFMKNSSCLAVVAGSSLVMKTPVMVGFGRL